MHKIKTEQTYQFGLPYFNHMTRHVHSRSLSMVVKED